MVSEQIESIFGHQVRVRVMGLLRDHAQVLMIHHTGLNDQDELWLPPGGGVEYGESMVDALAREFEEETGLVVKVGDVLCVHEHLSAPLHAIELFFSVVWQSGTLALGSDPETKKKSILKKARWVGVNDLKNKDKNTLHPLFQGIESIDDLFAKQGFFYFGN